MIEALCFGDMRKALNWFSVFLTSGATDVDKMLSIYRRDGQYFVPFHEFVKSIMLSERRYYSENHSPILNLFDCGQERNSGHFTTLRLLGLLLSYAGQDHPEGRGYVDIGHVLSSFEDVFDNREDLVRALNRCIQKQLIEANTRSTENINGAAFVRVTSAGWYYVVFLVNSFSYLDLVLQDAPLNDSGLEAFLRDSVHRVDNMGGHESEKVERTERRFARVEAFLDYLDKEEKLEAATFSLAGLQGPLGTRWTREIRAAYEDEREYIRRRLRENRERYADDMSPRTMANSDFDVNDDDESDE